MTIPTNPEQHLFTSAHAAVQRLYPGRRAVRVTIHLDGGEKISLPVPLIVSQYQQDPQPIPHPEPKKSTPKHSPDFRSVDWFGATYTFSPGQAAIVRILWEAWENGTSEVGGDYLLTEAGLVSTGISDVFKRSPAWKAMIVEGQQQGTWRLSAPQ